MVSTPANRPILARDLAGTVAYAGVDPTLERRALQDALRVAIASRRGYCWWDVDHAGWVVTLFLQRNTTSTASAGRSPRLESGLADVPGAGDRVLPRLNARAPV